MNVLPVHFAKRKTYKFEVTMDSRFTHCCFSFSEKVSGITQKHTGKYMKWSSAYAKYLSKTISFRAIDSKLLNCYICNGKEVSKKFGNEEAENVLSINTSPFTTSMVAWPPMGCVYSFNWMTPKNIRGSLFLCSEKCLAGPTTPSSQVTETSWRESISGEGEEKKPTSALKLQQSPQELIFTTFKYS